MRGVLIGVFDSYKIELISVTSSNYYFILIIRLIVISFRVSVYFVTVCGLLTMDFTFNEYTHM